MNEQTNKWWSGLRTCGAALDIHTHRGPDLATRNRDCWFGGGGGRWDECPGDAQPLLLSDKSHIFADQINLIDITQNDGGKVSTFIFAFAKRAAKKHGEKMRINEFHPQNERPRLCFGLMVALFCSCGAFSFRRIQHPSPHIPPTTYHLPSPQLTMR